MPETGNFLLAIIGRLQEIPVRVQESGKILQEIHVRLQENVKFLLEFVIRVQENVKFLQENVVRVQEIGECLQEIGNFLMDFGHGIKENLLVLNELSENDQKTPLLSARKARIKPAHRLVTLTAIGLDE